MWQLIREISKKCKENGIETEDIVVHINGDQITAVISTAGNITQEQERGIRDGLARDFGIEEKNCQLLMGKDEQTTLAGDSASGPFTDGNRIHPPFQFLHRRIVEKAVLHVTHYSVNYIFLDNPSRTQNHEK